MVVNINGIAHPLTFLPFATVVTMESPEKQFQGGVVGNDDDQSTHARSQATSQYSSSKRQELSEPAQRVRWTLNLGSKIQGKSQVRERHVSGTWY
jgi:hypothetical protein